MTYFQHWTFPLEEKHKNNYIPYMDIHLLMTAMGSGLLKSRVDERDFTVFHYGI